MSGCIYIRALPCYIVNNHQKRRRKKKKLRKTNRQKQHAHAASVFTHPPHADIITKKHHTAIHRLLADPLINQKKKMMIKDSRKRQQLREIQYRQPTIFLLYTARALGIKKKKKNKKTRALLDDG